MNNFLEVRNVSKSYDKDIALVMFSITNPVCSVFGLLGHTGSLRVSLLRCGIEICARDSGETQ